MCLIGYLTVGFICAKKFVAFCHVLVCFWLYVVNVKYLWDLFAIITKSIDKLNYLQLDSFAHHFC